MGCSLNGYVRINQYALVSYIPDPLGKFLDLLRLKLAPECRPHAHVTVLPPRPLNGSFESAKAELQKAANRFQPFEVKLGSVEMFEASEVIYIEVANGEEELRRMHRRLNRGAVKYEEPYAFHPHITLAQNLQHERVQETLENARKLWSEWDDTRTFPVDVLSFVQNTEENCWIDLVDLHLSHEPAGMIR